MRKNIPGLIISYKFSKCYLFDSLVKQFKSTHIGNIIGIFNHWSSLKGMEIKINKNKSQIFKSKLVFVYLITY